MRTLSNHMLNAACLAGMSVLCGVVCLAQITSSGAASDSRSSITSYIEVQPGVRLEVLDFGGNEQPMVLLTALGSDAHEWDHFAPKLVGDFHVFAISRRGFGGSSVPAFTRENRKADRLGDDVLEVMNALGIERPILVGWSVGGAELSSIGSRYPKRVKALIYLDSGYEYAYYGQGRNDPELNRSYLAGLLEQAAHKQYLSTKDESVLLASLERNEADLRRDLEKKSKRPQAQSSAASEFKMPQQMTEIEMNGQEYTNIQVPILAIFAYPVALRFTKDRVERAAEEARANVGRKLSVDTFARGLPKARVISIAHAGHDVWKTNEAQVIRDIQEFVASWHPTGSS